MGITSKIVPTPEALDAAGQYFRIPINLYKKNDFVPQDLFMLYQGNYILYRPKKSRWTDEDSNRLVEFGIKDLFIRCESEAKHFAFLETNLTRVLGEKNTPISQKASVLYQSATGIAEDVFKSPRSTETFARSKKIVNHTIDLLAKDSSAFLQMISLSSHDYYTYTHCVNVMTFSIALLSALGIKDSKLLEDTAIGAFLHDIGKTRVPLSILNKPGPLLEDEWRIMKQHPEFGIDILNDKPLPERGKNVILEHHEKINGIGYPYGLKEDKIQLISQVVSVCDAYDAMTTNRCYQKAKKPFEAFQIITQEMKGHFNLKIIEKFIEMLNANRAK